MRSPHEGRVPISIWRGDNPGSVRQRKYLTGTNFLVDAVGIEVAPTPRTLVWSRGKARLYRYENRADDRLPVPILLVYALILRPYILDLTPGRSLVEALVARGFDVYLLDWGIPSEADGDLGLDTFIVDYLPSAVRRVQALSSVSEVSMLGHCQGGTIATTYAALFPEHLRNLILLAAPILFAPAPGENAGFYATWARHLPVHESDALHLGNPPTHAHAAFIRAATRAIVTLTGTADLLAFLRGRLERDEALRAWLAICRWVDDAVPFPGRAFRQWIQGFYQENVLASGRLGVRGRPALRQITASLLNVVGTRDLVTPMWQSAQTPELVASEDTHSVIVDAGHVGLVVGPTAKQDVWEPIMAWLAKRSD
ncbi:MAG: alpha/beta fold hydrolase [Actinomycetota bacterium]|nr:alpha/beta fold hydrolase [Actinomycetota bacterium]